jgi:hypothetical protein
MPPIPNIPRLGTRLWRHSRRRDADSRQAIGEPCTVSTMQKDTIWERFKLWLARRISNRR